MANLMIDTNSPQYVRLLNGLGTLRTVLAPRIRMLLKLPRDKQRAWLQRDPLMRRTIKMAQAISELIGEEVSE